MKSDIQIAQEANIEDIINVANGIGIKPDELELYGKYKAKLSQDLIKRVQNNKDGKLILVTAINPTPAGEGKTTTTVGLGQAMNKIGENAIIALREPSLGPCMGLKGGAAGGGYSQVVPMDDINLHFTGDMHAISSAHALLASAIDNHIFHGNELNIDISQVIWKRAVDMNDRALRNIIVGLGGKGNGVPREDSFTITVASEIMAVLCLSENLMDLKKRLSRIIIGYNINGEPVKVSHIGVQGAMTLLLKDAIKPNLVQTLENTPCIIHGGPFANIAHGCNSVIATKLALKLADYTITEAGFGADLGAQKFFDIKCRISGLKPDAVVLVATIRALKYNGGVEPSNLKIENLEALGKGICNLTKHIENIKKYGVPIVVAVNVFESDTQNEMRFIKDHCSALNVDAVTSTVFSQGGSGGVELAKKIVDITKNQESNFKVLYDEKLTIKEKIEKVVFEIYGGDKVEISLKAQKSIKTIERLCLDKMPICIAKTQYSLSDNPNLLGRPEGFSVNVKDVSLSSGAGFIVVYLGEIMTMPGLPKVPAANDIDIDENGVITGLF